MAEHCPKEASAPRRDWISEETWATMRCRARARAHFFAAIRRRAALYMRYFLLAWRSAAPDGEERKAIVDEEWQLQAHELTFRRLGLRAMARDAASGIRADWAAWLAARAEGVADGLRKGDALGLWKLVWHARGRRRRKSLVLMAGTLDAHGDPVDSEEKMVALWQRQFLKEFADRGEVMRPDAYESKLMSALSGRAAPGEADTAAAASSAAQANGSSD